MYCKCVSTNKILSIVYVYTKSIYTHVIMKYLCKKYLTNCNFVLIILKLLTINKKAMQYTY